MVIDGMGSEWVEVTSGVPQGSLLGPLLFLVYVNDIGDAIDSKCWVFADDCVIFRQVNNKDDITLLQCDLVTLYQWLQRWQFPLNLRKCKAMSIFNKRSPPVCQ